mmetsp:Transcript_24438/g.39224  ORF Transcript_24438/g.39224 Transcript_24438/m.39224 type:complete len:293 (-) Transcript_24438:20-898(-)
MMRDLMVALEVFTPAKDQEVERIVVELAAIVVVNRPYPVVAVDEEISLDARVGFDDAGTAVPPLILSAEAVVHSIEGEEHLVIPRIVWPVVGRLAHHIKHQIAGHKIVASEAVILVDAGTRSIIADVIGDCRVGRENGAHTAGLLPKDTDLVDVVESHGVTIWIGGTRPVKCLRRAPKQDSRLARPEYLVLLDERVNNMAGQKDGVPPCLVENTLGHAQPRHILCLEASTSVHIPASGRFLVDLHECRPRLCERQPFKSNIVCILYRNKGVQHGHGNVAVLHGREERSRRRR